MQLREKDEKKRSLLWNIVMVASSAIILILLVVFSVSAMWGNPLEGTWLAEEKGYYLEIDDDNEMNVKGNFDGEDMEFDLTYTLDKANKLITIKGDEDNYEYVSNAWTTEETSEAAGGTSVTFSYSLGRKTLTLTDREYGVEFVFTRK